MSVETEAEIKAPREKTVVLAESCGVIQRSLQALINDSEGFLHRRVAARARTRRVARMVRQT
jgi:hypothetical protein